MGKCGDENTKPYKFTLDELADVAIDDTKEMIRGCGPNADGTHETWLYNRGWGWPDNGEFEYGGRGSGCGLCSDVGGGYGCECSGGNAIAGSRGKVKRKAFLGDPKGCCLANTRSKNTSKTVDGKTCDSKYRDVSSSECTAIMRDHCSSNDNIIKYDKCKDLVNSNGTLYNQLMTTYCNKNNTNANSSDCINWCNSNRTSCTVLSTIQDCQRYEIPSEECTAQKISDVKTDCLKYGILSEQGMLLGNYTCSVSGINSLKSDCNLYKLAEDTCTATGVAAAKVAEQSKKQSEEAISQSQQQFEYTKSALQQVIELPENQLDQEEEIISPKRMKKQTTTPTQSVDYTNQIIIIIILLILCCSSSSLILFFRSKGSS